jgi:hypothetical protein
MSNTLLRIKNNQQSKLPHKRLRKCLSPQRQQPPPSISRFWVLLLLLLLLRRVLKAKLVQFHENSINFDSEC